MNTTSDTHILISNDIESSDVQNDMPSLPLLLQPSYARSKSIIFDELCNFRITLKSFALDHSTFFSKSFSYITFLFLTILIPIFTSLSVQLGLSVNNKLVQLAESALATISFYTFSRFFRRYGLRQLLFLDDLQQDSFYVRQGYTSQLDKAFRYLISIILPSFLVELTHKIMLFTAVEVSILYVGSTGWILNWVVFVLVMVSWVYRTGVFLLLCVVFRLTCELQILRLQGVRRVLEGFSCCGDDDVGEIFGEHVRIRKQLCETSHRYRFFIIGCLVTITASQLGALFMVFTSKDDKNFFNSGELVVCSVVQLSGFIMCIIGAARITHRAQGIVSIATRWHMLLTLASSGFNQSKNHNPSQDDHGVCAGGDGNDADSDSSTDVSISVSSLNCSSFRNRQALVTYLQHNHGGITLHGYALDRGLLHTLFAFELSLVLWILSKVVVLS